MKKYGLALLVFAVLSFAVAPAISPAAAEDVYSFTMREGEIFNFQKEDPGRMTIVFPDNFPEGVSEMDVAQKLVVDKEEFVEHVEKDEVANISLVTLSEVEVREGTTYTITYDPASGRILVSEKRGTKSSPEEIGKQFIFILWLFISSLFLMCLGVVFLKSHKIHRDKDFSKAIFLFVSAMLGMIIGFVTAPSSGGALACAVFFLITSGVLLFLYDALGLGPVFGPIMVGIILLFVMTLDMAAFSTVLPEADYALAVLLKVHFAFFAVVFGEMLVSRFILMRRIEKIITPA